MDQQINKEVLESGYWYQAHQILEVLHFVLQKDRNPFKYIELNVSFDDIETLKMFLVGINLIYNAIKQMNEVAVVCHLGHNHYTALSLNACLNYAPYNDSIGHTIPFQL